MSDFNTSNELASQLVCGCYYQSNEPCFKLTKIVFHHGFASDDRIVITDDGTDWAKIASRIQALLAQGYGYVTLPCEYCGATEFEDVLHCDECDEPILHGWKQGTDHFWCGDRDQGDVWFFDKPARNDLHPTMKPVGLVERAIRNSSKSRDIVVDPFGGSGTTLMAAERTGRRARLIELDPKYVDVVVQRWQEQTG